MQFLKVFVGVIHKNICIHENNAIYENINFHVHYALSWDIFQFRRNAQTNFY